MISLGIKQVSIYKIRLPGDMIARSKEPRIAERAASIERFGMIHKPLVRKRDMLLVAGRDRVAALMHLKRDMLLVEYIDCEDSEIALIEREENSQRRHDPAEQTRLMLELVETRTQEILLTDPTLRASGSGRPKSARGLAREEIARSREIKPRSVLAAEHRQKRKERERAKAASSDPADTSPIRLLGMNVTASFVADVKSSWALLNEAATNLARAQARITELEKSRAPFPRPRLARLKESLHAIAYDVRGARPEALCPACKGLDIVQNECGMCVGTGFITQSQVHGVLPALWDEQDPRVLFRGQTRRIDDVCSELGITPTPPPVEEPW